MKEVRDIIDAYEVAVKAGTQIALATVVQQVEGFSYRREGAKKLHCPSWRKFRRIMAGKGRAAMRFVTIR